MTTAIRKQLRKQFDNRAAQVSRMIKDCKWKRHYWEDEDGEIFSQDIRSELYLRAMFQDEGNPPLLKLTKYNKIAKIDDDKKHFYKDCGHDVVLKDGTEWYISPESFKSQLERSYKKVRFIGVKYLNQEYYPNQIWLAFKIWGLSYLGEICVPYSEKPHKIVMDFRESVETAFRALFEKIPIHYVSGSSFLSKESHKTWDPPAISVEDLPDYEKAMKRELPKSQKRAMDQVWEWINKIEFQRVIWNLDEGEDKFDLEFKWPEMSELGLNEQIFVLEDSNVPHVEELVGNILHLLDDYFRVHHIHPSALSFTSLDIRAKAPSFCARIEPIFEKSKRKAHRKQVKQQLRHWLEPAVKEFSVEEIHEWVDELTVSSVMEE